MAERQAQRPGPRVAAIWLALSAFASAAAGVLWATVGASAAGGPAVAALAALALAASASRRFSGLAFTVWVFAFAAAAAFYPAPFVSVGGFEPKKLIVPLVQVILLGMGMTLTVGDFKRVLQMPRGVLAGFVLQFTVMPVMGFAFARLFGLEAEVAAGLILIGSCPGGVASNVIAYLARANVPLSVTMTACSTLLSPLMTPLAMKLLAGTYVPIDAWGMMLSIVEMIIAPLAAGLLIHRYLPALARRLTRVLPVLAMLSICIIIAITIALSRSDLATVGFALLGAAACHNAAGYALGYVGARAIGLDYVDAKTVAIEVGMQNGGMATGLAFNVLKSPLAALGSAVFGPWSAITASALASWWRRKAVQAFSPESCLPQADSQPCADRSGDGN